MLFDVFKVRLLKAKIIIIILKIIDLEIRAVNSVYRKFLINFHYKIIIHDQKNNFKMNN